MDAPDDQTNQNCEKREIPPNLRKSSKRNFLPAMQIALKVGEFPCLEVQVKNHPLSPAHLLQLRSDRRALCSLSTMKSGPSLSALLLISRC